MSCQRRSLQAGAVGVVLVIVSCAAPSTTPPQPPPSPSAESAVVPVQSSAEAAQRAAVAVYVGMWQAMARAGRTSDWKSPELDRYATGLARASIVRSLYADHFKGVVTRGIPTNSPVVRSVEPPEHPDTVLIDDCGDSTHSLKYHQGTDRPAGDGPGGGRRAITAEVLLQPDGTWRVNRFAVQALGTC